MDPEAGRKAYEAYRSHCGKRSLVTGDKLPKWEKLNDLIRGAWIAAANAAALHDRQVRGGI